MSLLSQEWQKVLPLLFTKRGVAACVLILFCFQFSRFYLIVELDRFVCLEPNHIHTASSLSGHDHHPEGGDALSEDQESGYSLQHCKDTFNGIALTPVQPLGFSFAAPVQRPETAWASRLPENQQVIDNVLAPPFQPPRS